MVIDCFTNNNYHIYSVYSISTTATEVDDRTALIFLLRSLWTCKLLKKKELVLVLTSQ